MHTGTFSQMVSTVGDWGRVCIVDSRLFYNQLCLRLQFFFCEEWFSERGEPKVVCDCILLLLLLNWKSKDHQPTKGS